MGRYRFCQQLATPDATRPRELGVLFRSLCVSAASWQIAGFLPQQPSVSSIFELVSLPFRPLTLLKAIQAIRHPQRKFILSGFEGVVRPEEMLRTPMILLQAAIGD